MTNAWIKNMWYILYYYIIIINIIIYYIFFMWCIKYIYPHISIYRSIYIYIHTHTYIYTMEYYSVIKGGFFAICDNMDGLLGHCAKWNKSDTERQILCDLTFFWNLNKNNKNWADEHREQTGGCRRWGWVCWGWAKWVKEPKVLNFQL